MPPAFHRNTDRSDYSRLSLCRPTVTTGVPYCPHRLRSSMDLCQAAVPSARKPACSCHRCHRKIYDFPLHIFVTRLAPGQSKHQRALPLLNCLKSPINEHSPSKAHYSQHCKYLFSLGTDSKEIERLFMFENTELTLTQEGKNKTSVRRAGIKLPG